MVFKSNQYLVTEHEQMKNNEKEEKEKEKVKRMEEVINKPKKQK